MAFPRLEMVPVEPTCGKQRRNKSGGYDIHSTPQLRKSDRRHDLPDDLPTDMPADPRHIHRHNHGIVVQ